MAFNPNYVSPGPGVLNPMAHPEMVTPPTSWVSGAGLLKLLWAPMRVVVVSWTTCWVKTVGATWR